MSCLSPISIKKPAQDDPKVRLTVPCGRCAGCLSDYRTDWAIRLEEELKVASSADFVTFTYNDTFLPVNDEFMMTLNPDDLRFFFKKLWKKLPKDHKVKYFAVGEYGDKTHRPHYHILFFNLNQGNNVIRYLSNLWSRFDSETGALEPIGHVDRGDIEPASIMYCLKYSLKHVHEREKEWDGRVPPFSRMSKKIGESYMTRAIIRWHKDDLTRQYYVKPGGQKCRLPRYYKDRLYSDAEKQKAQEYRYEAESIRGPERQTSEEFKAEIEQKVAYSSRVLKKIKANRKL